MKFHQFYIVLRKHKINICTGNR